MSVKLVSKNEKFVYKYDDAEFYYRRISTNDLNVLRRKHTVRGVLREDDFGQELLMKHLIGWKNVLGEDGKQVPFDKELIFELPSPILVELISRINGVETDDEEISGVKLEKK